MDTGTIITALMTFFGTTIGYIYGNRKNQAETDGIVLKNVRELLSVYQDTIADLKDEIKRLEDKLDAYEKQIEEMSRELKYLKEHCMEKKQG